MTEKTPVSKKGFSADWFMRGALTKIGDTLDRFTGRKWIPSSSLSTSELIVRIKAMLDSEARQVAGKGTVVPHNIKLKMQWDKFSTGDNDSLERLEHEILAAAADHINDSLYYTYAPLNVVVKQDYFTEGVKLFVSFDAADDQAGEVEMNVTIPGINIKETLAKPAKLPTTSNSEKYIARFEVKGSRRDKQLEFSDGGRLSVGRKVGNDLIIDDISVSKIHAALVLNNDISLSVADTGSTNGTFVNNVRTAYGKAVGLVAGDKVKFGDIEVVFEYIPRPVEIVEDVPAEEDDETIAIDGLEFRTRIPSQTPDDSAPMHSVPNDTLKKGFEKILDMADNDKDEISG